MVGPKTIQVGDDTYTGTNLILASGSYSRSLPGLEIGGRVITSEQALQMTFFFFLPSMLLSGFMFPFSGMPGWAQFIAKGLPLTYFVRGSRGVFLKDFNLIDMWPHLWPILVAGFVFSLLATLSYKKTLN